MKVKKKKENKIKKRGEKVTRTEQGIKVKKKQVKKRKYIKRKEEREKEE